MRAGGPTRLIFDLTAHMRQIADRKEIQSMRLIFEEIYNVIARHGLVFEGHDPAQK
jgi:hypothetical protein